MRLPRARKHSSNLLVLRGRLTPKSHSTRHNASGTKTEKKTKHQTASSRWGFPPSPSLCVPEEASWSKGLFAPLARSAEIWLGCWCFSPRTWMMVAPSVVGRGATVAAWGKKKIKKRCAREGTLDLSLQIKGFCLVRVAILGFGYWGALSPPSLCSCTDYVVVYSAC